jgi:hypothetical protein
VRVVFSRLQRTVDWYIVTDVATAGFKKVDETTG